MLRPSFSMAMSAFVAASLVLGPVSAGPPAKPAVVPPATKFNKPTIVPTVTKPPTLIPVNPAMKNPFEAQRGAMPVGAALPPVRPLMYQPVASSGFPGVQQYRPDPPLVSVFWWPLRVGPNNDPNWINGLSYAELQKELQNTMARLDELGGPGIWNACKEYNDWQRHRELLLDAMRALRRKK